MNIVFLLLIVILALACRSGIQRHLMMAFGFVFVCHSLMFRDVGGDSFAYYFLSDSFFLWVLISMVRTYGKPDQFLSDVVSLFAIGLIVNVGGFALWYLYIPVWPYNIATCFLYLLIAVITIPGGHDALRRLPQFTNICNGVHRCLARMGVAS